MTPPWLIGRGALLRRKIPRGEAGIDPLLGRARLRRLQSISLAALTAASVVLQDETAIL